MKRYIFMKLLKIFIAIAIPGLPLLISIGCSDSGSNPTGSGNQPPVLAAIGNRNATVGVSLSFGISATDVDGTILVFTTSALPAGASFVDNGNGTGNFSWSPIVSQIGVQIIIFFAADSSAKDSEVVSITVAQAVSFANNVRDILTTRCATSGCHGLGSSQGGFTMGNVTWSEIRNGAGNHGAVLVAGNAASSNLFLKTTSNPPFGARMPADGTTLSTADQTAIRDWINQGALDN